MKRFLYVIGGLNVVWLLVSLGGVAFTGQLTFWTWNLMGSLLAMIVLAPLLVFVDSGLGSSSGRASSTSTSPQASSDTPSSPEMDASDAEAVAPPKRQKEPAGASGTAPSSAASSDTRARSVDEPAGDRERSSAASSTAPTSPSSEASSSGWASQLLAYAGSFLLILWVGTSIAALFVDRSNLTFWTWSVMWGLLATILWAPILVFVLDPFNASSPSRSPSSAAAGATETSASPATAASPASHSDDSTDPFVAPEAAPDLQDADPSSSPRADTSPDADSSSESTDDAPASLSARTNPRSTEDWTPWPPEEDAQE